MTQDHDAPTCGCGGGCSGQNLDRREFLRLAGVGGAVLGTAGLLDTPAALAAENQHPVPADKNLSPAWVKSLFERGARTVYRGAELDRIGMPVGGICTGQLYLGGDGRLWQWDLFNARLPTGDAHYAHPPRAASPLDQGFAVRVDAGGKSEVRRLDRTGFPDVTFCGEYPIGFVEYRDEHFPVAVALEAFSPFIPLNADDSGLPATLLHFTLKNTGSAEAVVELAGWLENAVCLNSGKDLPGVHRNRVVKQDRLTFLDCSAEAVVPQQAERPPIVFADFEGEDYGPWKVEGTAFGKGPAKGPVGVQAGRLGGYLGKGFVNTYQNSDEPQGKLTSPEFTIDRPHISFLIGGGSYAGQTCMNLLVDGRVARTATGRDSEQMHWANWNVRELAGKKARIEIVDRHSGGWGHILVDQIEFRDGPRSSVGPLEAQNDFGTMGLALLDPQPGDRGAAALPEADVPLGLFATPAAGSENEARRPFDQRLRGALSRKLTLAPGAEAKVVFAVTWCFPKLRLPGFRDVVGRHYSNRFRDALAVARYLAENQQRLTETTRLWHRTWYDSTLPRWLLDRLFATASTLATSTCFRFQSGRFYGWEGVGCCEGTCTHVWHYAHAVARLFPELERSAREMQDLGPAFVPDTGLIRFRGEISGDSYATDGQAGDVLRCYREHLMSADDAFLKRNWPRIKKATEFLIRHDGNDDGILEDAQPNTLDTAFYGPNSMCSSLYLAALRAAEEMAKEAGDEAFARRARAIFESGSRRLAADLWNGEYFIHKPDLKHPEALKTDDGCFTDQVFGQSWAFQVGLGRILPQEQVQKALAALWKYNWTPDVGPYREVYKNGRWYAMPGEPGLIMCTWPRGGGESAGGKVNRVFAGYLNEVWNGCEYQAAGHMIWEGLVREGLAVCRAVHDRFHAARRNPWNEVECGDHYARSMAGYGVYLAVCGFEYHGPHGHLAFAPRLTPDDFRAAFTTAEGWGTFQQQRREGRLQATLEVRWGQLRLRRLALATGGQPPARVAVRAAGRPVEVTHEVNGGRLTIALPADLLLRAGERLEVIA